MTSAAVELLVLGTPAPSSTLQCIGLRSGNTKVRVNELIMCTITIKDANGVATIGVPQDFATPVIVNGVLALSGLVSPVNNYSSVMFNVTAANLVSNNVTVSVAIIGGLSLLQGLTVVSISQLLIFILLFFLKKFLLLKFSPPSFSSEVAILSVHQFFFFI